MLFYEQIAATKRNIKLQVFASDVDPTPSPAPGKGSTRKRSRQRCRRNVWPASSQRKIEVTGFCQSCGPLSSSPYKTSWPSPVLRLDLVSCRNLLIYLLPEAQEKVISFFHFALREGGVLLFGSPKRSVDADGRFEASPKPSVIYRHIGRSRPGELGFPIWNHDGARTRRAGQEPAPRAKPRSPSAAAARHGKLRARGGADQRKLECLYSLGPTDRYLRVRRAIRRAICSPWRVRISVIKLGPRSSGQPEKTCVLSSPAAATNHEGKRRSYIAVHPALIAGENLLLICFIDEPMPAKASWSKNAA